MIDAPPILSRPAIMTWGTAGNDTSAFVLLSGSSSSHQRSRVFGLRYPQTIAPVQLTINTFLHLRIIQLKENPVRVTPLTVNQPPQQWTALKLPSSATNHLPPPPTPASEPRPMLTPLAPPKTSLPTTPSPPPPTANQAPNPAVPMVRRAQILHHLVAMGPAQSTIHT
jgi:hypothetical protein